jgi:hypothetical protein
VHTIAWLLDSDPAIRWQVLRDLADAEPALVALERSRVTSTGLGAELLGCQLANGSWHKEGAPEWLPTLFSLLLLRSTGADPEAPVVKSAMARLRAGFRWHEELGGKTFFEGETEPCINGGALAVGAYFGHPSESLVARLLGEQLEDGGWNCEAPKSQRSSFHSTICVLEGLLGYERAVGGEAVVAAARRRGERYLLERRLFRRRSTGEVVDASFLELAFPPRYQYDVLRALDYFRSSGAPFQPPMAEACATLRLQQTEDGRWPLQRSHEESLPLPFPERVGEPSRWNTLRALRVLRWADETATASER